MTTIGILGAGKLGTVLARLATEAGYRTLVAGSGSPHRIELILHVLSPGAIAAEAEDVIAEAEVVILALPLGRHHEIPAARLAGKIVIDAMNYWPPSDGVVPEFEGGASSSDLVASAMPEARVVKAFSHLGYHELDSDARPAGAADRHAIAIASDDNDAAARVAEIVDSLGYDPVMAGGLVAGSAFAPGSRLFGVSADSEAVKSLLRPVAAAR